MPSMLRSHARHSTLAEGVLDIVRHLGAITECASPARLNSNTVRVGVPCPGQGYGTPDSTASRRA
jgi:hypothetical protein